MDAEDQGLPKLGDAAPPAEQRSGSDRRMAGRRHADRRSAGSTPEIPNEAATKELASREPIGPNPAGREPTVARKYYFRSFEDRRLGIDRRLPADAGDERPPDERPTANDRASLVRRKD